MCSQARSQTLLNFQSSIRTPSATLTQTHSISGHSTKINRKPVFHVFCDDDIHQVKSTADTANHRAPKSSHALQTVVNNKENQVPELNNRSISASRQPTRPSTRSRVLGDKTLLASASVNCVDKWDSIIPFAPCRSPSTKSTKLHPIKTQTSKARVNPSLQASNENQKKTKITSPHTKSAKRLSSHLYCPSSENTHPGTTQAHDLDNGLNELVSKLEALRTTDEEAYEILEPLPPNATCPGAPKIPSSFTMPLYVADDDCCEDDQVAELKSPISHQMSPLAEVTEAFTGLQGGWSPPLETLSPVMQGHSFDIPPFSYPSTESDGDLIPAQPHTFRRHESVSVSAGPSGEQPTRVRSQGPLRI
ncbi:hypothetical protein MJO28_002459 [Puccinia striiformis f. sp. tritici]|uniref:Uncharacterized protein n=1 Tax=Puccinia striiformis f. sp. tritici TaxID=168172 RepID=A0ACC0ERF4_9BASI|nr:hypothetical protein MJO28_002459 [Puccinia striiformis f. sp. tritici]